jgi:hypothetical protein
MRTTQVLSLLFAGATLTGGGRLVAQAVERTDIPARGALRVTFDPRIMTWNDEFTDHGRVRLGAPLSGDTIGARSIPVIARLQQNVRFVSGVGGFVANLGAGLLSAYQERRTYPVKAEFGLTERLSLSLMVPIVRLGAPLSGDTIGARSIPVIARLQQNVRFVSGFGGFVANLGAGLLSAYQERRTYPVKAEFGLTEHLSLSLMVPIVRVATRTAFQLSSRGQNLGLNPRLNKAGADAAYATFFAQFQASLQQLDQNISAGQYGCAGSAPCAARDSSAYWHSVFTALHEMAYGVGQPGSPGSPLMPLDSTAAGRGIDTTVARIGREMASASFMLTGLSGPFLLPTDSLTGDLVAAAIVDSAIGFGYTNRPFRDDFHYGLGDMELGAKYRFLAGAHYRAALAALVRLPTSAPDSGSDLLRQTPGEHRFDLEGQLTQELLAGPVWLNVAIRAGRARAGTRVRRVAPPDAFLVPAAATSPLRWEPGDYLGVDVAPLLQLAPEFAAGFTAGFWTKARDHYAFQSPQDSVALATRLGAPTAANVLDQGTSERRVRLGFAATYHGPTLEGGFSVEQTVSGAERVPGATVYRLVLRLVRRLF